MGLPAGFVEEAAPGPKGPPPGFQLESGPRTNAELLPFERDALNPAAQMSGGQRFLAGVGKTFTDLGQGAQQILGMGPSRQEVDQRRDRDASLMATPEGFGGSIAGGVAATIPAAVAGPSMAAAAGTGALYGALQPVGTGESRPLNTAVGAGTAGALKYGVDKAAPWLSKLLMKREAEVASGNARAQELARVLREGQDVGFRVPPATANPSAVNRLLEAISGKTATKQEASIANQDVAYGQAQKVAGLPPNQALTEEALATARDNAAAPYRAVAQNSSDAAKALEMWRTANNDAKLAWKENARQGTVASHKAATAADEMADYALDEIERIAGPAAKAQLQAARVQIAKIHTVERSMEGSSFDPSELVRQSNRGVKLSDELKQMADFTRDFPKAMERPQLQGSPGVHQLVPWLGGASGSAAGAAIGGIPGAAIGSALGTAAAHTVPPMTRSLILSGPYQRLMTTPQTQGPGQAIALAKALMNNPQLQRMLPAGAGLVGANLEQ